MLVTDIRMPTMNGDELLRIVKERHPQTIRMVVTAFADIDPILRAINEGFVARYIIKPWVRAELVQVLRWAIEAWAFGRDSAAAAPAARDRAARHARQHRRRCSSMTSSQPLMSHRGQRRAPAEFAERNRAALPRR